MGNLGFVDQSIVILLKRLPIFRLPVFWLSIGSGAFIYFMLPAGVIVMNDDFGYLGSVIETLQRGRPWTDDWLEPWSASLAILSALAYKLTGSFHFAIQGMQAIYASASAAGAFILIRSRGISSRSSLVIVLLGLSFPTLVWKSLEYTGMVLYLPCLLWAIWAAEQRRWTIFCVFWVMALASRQSAIAWFAIPLWAVFTGLFSRSSLKATWRPPVLVLVCAIATYVLLTALMNQTDSQIKVTQHFIERLEAAKSYRNLVFGLGIGVIFTGIGALFLGRLVDGFPINSKRFAASLCALALGPIVISFFDNYPPIYAEHACFVGWQGNLYINLIIATGLAGWMMGRFSVRWDLFFASLAALALVGLRTDVWDYYFADIALFALFSVRPPRAEPAAGSSNSLPVSICASTVILFAGFHLYFAFDQKLRVDNDYAACVLSEKALRAGKLDVLDIGCAPFGFIGWHLNRHYVATDGLKEAGIGGWMSYLRTNAVEIRQGKIRFWRDSFSLKIIREVDIQQEIASDVFPLRLFWYRRYAVVHLDSGKVGTPALKLDRSLYHYRRFPLTDSEWQADIDFPSRELAVQSPRGLSP